MHYCYLIKLLMQYPLWVDIKYIVWLKFIDLDLILTQLSAISFSQSASNIIPALLITMSNDLKWAIVFSKAPENNKC